MPKKMMDGIQSLDRGLEILRLLAENGPMTASAAAERLGVHQSSASRLLRSLQSAGLVRKPDFHSFAPDFGLLAFAGMAMLSFPEISASASVCDSISRRHGHCATAGTLFDGRLVYFARITPPPAASLTLVDNSEFPIYRSSLGLLLSHRLGRNGMTALLGGKMRSDGVNSPEKEAAKLFHLVEESVSRHGILFLRDFGINTYNAAMTFETSAGVSALAIYGEKGELAPEDARRILEDGVMEIKGLAERKTAPKGGMESK